MMMMVIIIKDRINFNFHKRHSETLTRFRDRERPFRV